MSRLAQVSTPGAHTPWAEKRHGSFACPSTGTLHWAGGTLAPPPWCWECSSCCAQGMDVFKTTCPFRQLDLQSQHSHQWGEPLMRIYSRHGKHPRARAACRGCGWDGRAAGCWLLPPRIPQQLSFPVPASPAEAVVQGNGFGFCSL